MGFIDFTNGEVLTADQMDTVMRQGIMRFADAAARDTALSAVLAEGMMAYLDDTDEVLKYDGSQWVNIVDPSSLTIEQSQVTDLVSDLADKQDDVITTQGDLVIGDASGDPVRLPVGSADQVLTSDGTTVSFQDAGGAGGFNTIELVTASNAAYDVSGISGVARITVFGGGGSGVTEGVQGEPGSASSFSDGTTTTTASGGGNGGAFGTPPAAIFLRENNNGGNVKLANSYTTSNNDGRGGEIKVAYYDLSTISTVDIVVGAGGAGDESPTDGGDGSVTLEYAS